MKIKDDYGLQINTDKRYNHILEHRFDLEINGDAHEIEADVYTECDNNGEVIDFYVSLIDDDGFYTESQTEEIETFLTEKLR